MFAKGPTPGYSPKKDFLKKCPTAVCKRETYILPGGSHISGYYIYLNKKDDKHYISAGSSKEAWEKADSKWQRTNE